MTTEFISGLCSSLSPVQNRILNTSSKFKKIATSVRRATCELPADLSIIIAKNIVEYECNKLYVKIIEIVVLLFIRFNRRDFIVKCFIGDMQRHYYSPPCPITFNFPECHFLIPKFPNEWMIDAVKEIVMGNMWNHIVPYIYDVNAFKTVLSNNHEGLDMNAIIIILKPIQEKHFDWNSISQNPNITWDIVK
jgi:hypothetical protein